MKKHIWNASLFAAGFISAAIEAIQGPQIGLTSIRHQPSFKDGFDAYYSLRGT